MKDKIVFQNVSHLLIFMRFSYFYLQFVNAICMCGLGDHSKHVGIFYLTFNLWI